mmetsp:Transcript_3719/g.5760  ORF Transcript_3719/g.5760 Transcript_3719/m.5760 type:complete len:240 (+) Transcript_3719:157-876(+)
MSYAIDKPKILSMENPLQVDVIDREVTYTGTLCNDEDLSPYIQTTLEEYSRYYHTASIAPSEPAVLDTIENLNNSAAHLRYPGVEENVEFEDYPQLSIEELYNQSRFLLNYHPQSSPPQSTFSCVPRSNKRLVDNCGSGYTNLLLSFGPKVRLGKYYITGPIFGTASLYSMNPHRELIKITGVSILMQHQKSLRSKFKVFIGRICLMKKTLFGSRQILYILIQSMVHLTHVTVPKTYSS